LAGIDLDGFNTGVEDTKANLTEVLPSTKKPYNRLTGVGIDITVRYYNIGKYTSRPTGMYYAFVDVRGRMGWFMGPATIYYRDFPEVPLRKPSASSPRAAFAIDENNVVRKSYGVKFFFQPEGGSIGVFYWAKLWSAIIEALVVFGVVNTILVLLARWCFGYNSSIYSQQMYVSPSGETRELYVNKLIYAILFGNDDKLSKEGFKECCNEHG